MLEIQMLGTIPTIIILIIASGAASWAVAQTLKKFLNAYFKHEGKAKPWWWAPTLNLISTAGGGGCGALLLGTSLGVLIGLAAGAMNGLIVTVVKGYIKKKGADLIDSVAEADEEKGD